MRNFKERLYNYEADPPASIWDNIVSELDDREQKMIQMPALRKRSKFIFYGITAAASLIIIFLSSLLFNKNDKNPDIKPIASTTSTRQDSGNTLIKDSLNNKALEFIIQSKKDKSLLTRNENNIPGKKYITIAGPGGQPVKISSKVATLIVSADNDYPPKAVWDKKINKWKQIMLSSTLSPTASNLLDIVQLSSMRGDN